MKYCRNTTINHVISQTHTNCLIDLNSLIVREGFAGVNRLFVNGEIVLDLDLAETIFAGIENRKEKNKSMDMAFGLTNADATKRQMLLVELKFNVRDVYSLRKNDLEGKVESSCNLLGNDPAIYQRFIFIVKTENIQEAISRFFRMIPKIDSKYVVLDIHLLKEQYFN